MRKTTCLALLLGLVAGADTAAAATVVSGVPEPPGSESKEPGGEVTVIDEAGVADRLAVSVSSGGVVVREVGGAALEARGSCRNEQPALVRCAPGHLWGRLGGGRDTAVLRLVEYEGYDATIDGGDGDDALRSAGEGGVALRGGPGDDALRGGSGWDRLVGGAGDDRLSGGRGPDELVGDGRSGRRAVPAGRDVLDGGAGRDLASWAERPAPVRVDLASRAPAGGAGEGDLVRAVEDVVGGRRNDVLRGTAGPNHLLGGPGSDRLSGRGGDDDLDAGIADDRSGAGDFDDAVDRLACGGGRDTVTDVQREALGRGCERLEYTDYDVLGIDTLRVQPRPAGPGRVRVHVPSYDGLSGRRRVEIRHRGRVIGRSRLVRARERPRWAVVYLRRALPDHGLVTVRFSGFDEVGTEGGGVARERFRFRYRLRR